MFITAKLWKRLTNCFIVLWLPVLIVLSISDLFSTAPTRLVIAYVGKHLHLTHRHSINRFRTKFLIIPASCQLEQFSRSLIWYRRTTTFLLHRKIFRRKPSQYNLACLNSFGCLLVCEMQLKHFGNSWTKCSIGYLVRLQACCWCPRCQCRRKRTSRAYPPRLAPLSGLRYFYTSLLVLDIPPIYSLGQNKISAICE